MTGGPDTPRTAARLALMGALFACAFALRAPGLTDPLKFEERDSFFPLVDASLGAFASTELGPTRLYAGAGPLLLFGSLDSDEEETLSDGTVIEVDERDSAFGVGGYLRGGLEFRLPDGAFMGIGVRAMSSSLDFGSDLGDVDVRGIQAFISYTVGF